MAISLFPVVLPDAMASQHVAAATPQADQKYFPN
jgi:hypothetical protein